MVNTLHFHCRHVGSIPSQGTKIQQVAQHDPPPLPAKKKKVSCGPLQASRAASANGYRALSAAVLGRSEIRTFRALPSCPADE